MELLASFSAAAHEHWPIWVVTLFAIVAAVIDGVMLKVPNWLTFPFIVAGWIYSCLCPGELAWYQALGWSLAGTAVAFALLYPFCAINFMGAGDVKMLMGIGAWVYVTHTFYAFCLTAIVGAVLAVGMAVWSGQWKKHYLQFWMISQEVMEVKDPEKIAELAAERKPNMLLLPYGIPIAIGSILYFAWTGMIL